MELGPAHWLQQVRLGRPTPVACPSDKHSLEELEAEERAELPDGFEDWPVDETKVN